MSSESSNSPHQSILCLHCQQTVKIRQTKQFLLIPLSALWLVFHWSRMNTKCAYKVTHKWAAYSFTHERAVITQKWAGAAYCITREWAVITWKRAGAAYDITRERAVITQKWAGKIKRTSKSNSAQMWTGKITRSLAANHLKLELWTVATNHQGGLMGKFLYTRSKKQDKANWRPTLTGHVGQKYKF